MDHQEAGAGLADGHLTSSSGTCHCPDIATLLIDVESGGAACWILNGRSNASLKLDRTKLQM
jgi:hypothetical protein